MNIAGLRTYSYADHLRALHLYSLERRLGPYTIIYIWKMLHGLAPNFQEFLIELSYSPWRGSFCPDIGVPRCRVGSLLYNSFRWRGVRLSNALPRRIRDLSDISVEVVKRQFGFYLSTIDDVPGEAFRSNSIVPIGWTHRADPTLI